MIRIAYLIDAISSDKAGTEKQLLEIIHRLNREIFEPILICLNTSPWLENNPLPCSVHVLGYKGLLKPNFPAVVIRLERLLCEYQVNIVQTLFEDSIFIGWLGALLSHRHPVLLSSRRDIGLGQDDLWYHSLFKATLPFVNRFFDGILANGKSVRTYVAHRERTSVEKITIIHNGIEPQFEDVDTPELFRLVSSELWIGITANLKPVKRIDLFIQALGVLRDNCPIDFHAVILGEGSQENMLKGLAKDLGLASRVHFMGSVSKVYGYLKHLDIGVLCSDREGFSNAIMEYMACGLPVVATAVGGNTELVDETNGIIVSPGDATGLGSAMAKLAQDSEGRRRLGNASTERINYRYAWNVIMPQWQDYYQKVMQRKRRQI